MHFGVCGLQKQEKKKRVLADHFSSPLAFVQRVPQSRNPALKHKDQESNTYAADFFHILLESLFGNLHHGGKASCSQVQLRKKRN